MLMLLLAATLSASATTADNDTVVIKNANQVTIVTNDSLQKIVVNGREGDEDYKYTNTIQLVDSNYISHSIISRDRWTLMPKVKMGKHDDERNSTIIEGTAHVYAGMTFPTRVQQNIDFSHGSSWEIGFTPFEFDVYLDRKEHHYLTFGLGFDWRNYRMTNQTSFVRTPDGSVALGTYPEGAKPKFSRIKVFSLTVPLLYQQRWGNDWGMGVGAMLNWNTYASIKTKYNMDGGSHKYVEKHIGQRRFTVDYMAILYNPFIDIYIKYSPQDVLKEPGVKFRALSIGFYI